ncbi:MAG: YihA family ribosome biogenesis GTP-binding protein [Saprospiraceae bacterium]|nr:YihA family ribosome biogenesis GTP-binding protein [Saprospiraceae bacterium]
MIREVHFKGSFPSLKKMPECKLPQFAFIGRSNVGKSSLINLLTERKSIAKVSKQPGKTQMINLFEVNEEWILVDLPGYGYAKESKKKRSSWKSMVSTYLLESPMLHLAFVLIDANVPPQAIDIEFINWLGQNGIPFNLVFTKIDRQNTLQNNKQIEAFRNKMLENWEELPPYFAVSSVTRVGQEDLQSYIDRLVKGEPV